MKIKDKIKAIIFGKILKNKNRNTNDIVIKLHIIYNK